jgi:SAM-dependent methyltransferase
MNQLFSSHTIILSINDKTYLFYQLLTRKGILVDSTFFINFFNFDNQETYVETSLQFKDVSTFSLSECLLDNSNGIYKNLNEQQLEFGTLSELIDLGKKCSIFITEGKNYIDKLGKKTNLFDQYHTGNFHQKIGEYVIKNHKDNSEWWWITQKFTNNFLETTNTPYNWVQEYFMKDFFTKSNINKKKVLDFGCGIGYYSSFFSKLGGNVTGVDPSERYLEIANSIYSDNGKVKYLKAEFENSSDFDFLDKDFDVIFLSDVFLYFFEPYKKMELTPKTLLIKLRTLLSKKGKIYIMDPHGFFHLQSWINVEKPFLISLEYVNRKFRVTPNLEELSIVVEEAGFNISKIRELKYIGTDPDKLFYSEFPFWWFFELSKNI